MKPFRKILRHMLGLDNAEEAYRNYFATTPQTVDYPVLRKMEGLGLVRCGRADGTVADDEMIYFNTTELGKLIALHGFVKALSVRQPWAWLIVAGFKDIENRSRDFRYRGPLLIHAGKAWADDYSEKEPNVFQHSLYWMFRNAGKQGQQPKIPAPEEMSRGGIVGMVNVVDCVSYHDSPWYGDQFGLVLEKAQRLPFVPLKGKLGLFTFDYEEAV